MDVWTAPIDISFPVVEYNITGKGGSLVSTDHASRGDAFWWAEFLSVTGYVFCLVDGRTQCVWRVSRGNVTHFTVGNSAVPDWKEMSPNS